MKTFEFFTTKFSTIIQAEDFEAAFYNFIDQHPGNELLAAHEVNHEGDILNASRRAIVAAFNGEIIERCGIQFPDKATKDFFNGVLDKAEELNFPNYGQQQYDILVRQLTRLCEEDDPIV